MPTFQGFAVTAGVNPVPVVVTAASQQTSPNTKYIANRPSGRVDFKLPTVASLKLGDQILIRAGKDSAGWKVSQNAGQTIMGNSNTTNGVTGYLQSQTVTDTVALEVTSIDQQAVTCDLLIISNRGTVDIS